MPLRGSAFLAIWHDIEAHGELEYNDWHTREHMPERVAVRGRSAASRRASGRCTSPMPVRSAGHEPVGLGTVDFATIFRTLDEIAFDGACILEVVTSTPLPDIEASLAALASAGPAKLPLVDTGRTG